MTDMTWIDQVDQVDQSTLDQGAPTYPYIQWVNGKPTLKQVGGVAYTGGWFMPASQQQVDDEQMTGWTRGTLDHENGDSTEGWFQRTLHVAILHTRRCWRVGMNGQSRRFPWNAYDEAMQMGKPSGRLQVLAMLPGDQLPTVLTLSGTAARAFAPSRQGVSVMGDLQRYVILPANKLARSKGKLANWPWRAFWLEVGAALDAKGGPVFTTVGTGNATSQVTHPVALGLNDKLTPEQIGKLFVGGANLKLFNETYADTQAWAAAWDAPAAPAQQATVSEQELEEIPF
jgi:hypothetical protein